jgi:hypothetical protein
MLGHLNIGEAATNRKLSVLTAKLSREFPLLADRMRWQDLVSAAIRLFFLAHEETASMLEKLRRHRNGFSAIYKFPVNAISRAHVDAEIERIRGCVIPIIRNHLERPFLVGSAVALTYGGRKCLVTALHVLTRNDDTQLLFFGHDGYAKPLGGNFQVSQEHDIAALALDPETIAALSHVPFLDETRIGSAAGLDGRFYASVAGYPHSASRLLDQFTLDTPMEVTSNTGRELSDGFVSVCFDKKEGGVRDGGHFLSRDPVGKSGGAIFGIPKQGINAVNLAEQAKLVGIPTDWKGAEKRIFGASTSSLLPLLARAIGSD